MSCRRKTFAVVVARATSAPPPGAALAARPEPLARGPYAPAALDPVTAGTVALQEPAASGAAPGSPAGSAAVTVALRGSLWHPADQPSGSPVIVLVHGNHAACHTGRRRAARSSSATTAATRTSARTSTSSFGTFLPGVAADYSTSVALSTGGATLTVEDPSAVATAHLVNGDLALASSPLARAATSPVGSSASPLALQTFPAPVSNDPVAVTFRQPISETEPLRTGSYAKTVVFTLSTRTP
jgi:hypothetical protein